MEGPQLLPGESPLVGAPPRPPPSPAPPGDQPGTPGLEGRVDPRGDYNFLRHVINITKAAGCPATCQQASRRWASVHLFISQFAL